MTDRAHAFGRCSKCGNGFTIAWGVVVIETDVGNVCSECIKADNDAENQRIGEDMHRQLQAKRAQAKRRQVQRARR